MGEQGNKTEAYCLRYDDWVYIHHANLRIRNCRKIAERSTTLTQYIYPRSLTKKGPSSIPFSRIPLFFFNFQFLSASHYQLDWRIEDWKKEVVEEKL